LDLRPTIAIDEKLFKRAIDELGDYLFKLWMYNWGEPLLHKRTPEMIRYAKAKDIQIILSTNLSIKLSDDYIERLVRSGLDVLIVSLDGASEETYVKYRVNGKFDLVRQNMLRIKAAKERLGSQVPKIVWQFLVFQHNEHEINDAQTIYKNWGADELHIEAAQMPLKEYNDGLAPPVDPAYNMYDPQHWVQREAVRQVKSGKSCSWLYGIIVLNPGGRVSPCCDVPSEKHDFGEFTPGGSFFDLWNNEKFQRARQLFIEWSKRPSRGIGTQWTKRLIGMNAMSAQTLKTDQIICQKCPIPYMQDKATSIVDELIYLMMLSSLRNRSMRDLARQIFSYLLMGLPFPSRRAMRAGLRKTAERLGL